MTKWKTEEILAGNREQVNEYTADWTADQLREKLALVLAAIYPIRTTLDGLVDNPDNGRYGGMTVSSGLFMDQTLSDVAEDFPEPFGYRLGEKTWEPVSFKWSEPPPGGLERVEASFRNAECPHSDTEILSVWQYGTACSIFVGSFDVSDVENLLQACRFPRAALKATEGDK